MPVILSDNNLGIDKNGNLSLGFSGANDGAGDAAHAYAKTDCFYNFPLNTLGITGTGATFGRTSAGIYTLAVTTNGTTQIGGIVPFPHRFIATATPPVAGGIPMGAPPVSAPHGYKIKDIVLCYTVTTLAATSVNVALATELQANNGARSATTTPMGAVTYENPIGTVVGSLPVATQANPYVCRAVPATPTFITADNTILSFEIVVVLPNTSVLTITQVGVHYAMALY